ncbi:MAG: signal peptidase I [Sphingopyxis sp.]|nr:signal peptidase I [Sphingopyxis sp.]
MTTAHKTEAKGESPLKLIRDIIVILLVVLGIHTIIAKPFYIPSESMMPILRNGDRLVVSKWPYGWSYSSVSFHLAPKMDGRLWGQLPERGDIVVLEHPQQRVDYIKRVIGLPGDTIEMRRGELILNGKAVKREIQPLLPIPVDANLPGQQSAFSGRIRVDAAGKRWIDAPVVRETLPEGVSYDTIDLGPDYRNDEFEPYLVPPGHVFLMGDNRDGSADSRVSVEEKGFGGAVPFDVISGRAEMITFSTDGTASWYNPLTWFSALRSGRAGTNLRPDKK